MTLPAYAEMRTHGVVDVYSVRCYKVFHPRPMLYLFDHNGFDCFVPADDIDRIKGEYATNNNRNIRKCDALCFNVHQREPAREISSGRDALPNLSINSDTLFRMIDQHMRASPDHSFEAKDMLQFFERYTNSLNDAERTFENFADTLAKRFPENVRRSPRMRRSTPRDQRA